MKTFSAFVSFIATSDEPISHYHAFRRCAIGKFGEDIGHDPELLGRLFEQMADDVVDELVSDFPDLERSKYSYDMLDENFTEEQGKTYASVQAMKLLRDLNDSDLMDRFAPTMSELRAYIARNYPLIPTN